MVPFFWSGIPFYFVDSVADILSPRPLVGNPVQHYCGITPIILYVTKLDSDSRDFLSVSTSQVRINAASSFSLGIVCTFIGATRVFDAMIVDDMLSSS